MNDLRTLLVELRRVGVQLWVDGDQLRYRAPRGALSAERIAELKSRKADVLRLLKKAGDVKTQAQAPMQLAMPTRPDVLPLSYAQERLWLLDQIGGLGGAFNIPAAVRLTGPLNVEALDASFAALVERHESLRTRFTAVKGVPFQVIDPPGAFALTIESLTVSPEAGLTRGIRDRVIALAHQSFDLNQEPLLRAHLLRLSEKDHVLVVSMHHIISDGWSIGILMREMGAFYAALANGRGAEMPKLPIQYADYAVWQRGWLQGAALERQIAYWKEQLSGAPVVLKLPTDRPRPTVQGYGGAVLHLKLPEELVARLNALAQSEGATLFMVLLAAFSVVLSRWSGQKDIIVGSPIAGRTHRELEGLIGLFVNMLALRIDLEGEPTFQALLSRVKVTALGAYQHQDLPFEKLVAELQPTRDLSRQPVFQVLFALQNVPREVLQVPGLQLTSVDTGQPTAKLDLSLYMRERDGQLDTTFEYSTELFERSTIERLASHLKVVLEAIVLQPGRNVFELSLVGDVERHCLVTKWNDAEVAFPSQKCLHELFTEQALRIPDAIAVFHEKRQLSYRELESCSNKLARHLRGLGVGPETIVGLCTDRTPEMVVGMLGILKAGGAYLPLDPGYPAERLAYMLAETRAPVVVMADALVPYLPDQYAGLLVQLDADRTLIESLPGSPVPNTARPDNLSYVIYTSGSTGKPKGVMIRHDAVLNLLQALQLKLHFTRQDILLAVTRFSFDMSVPEFYLPFMVGGAVALQGGQVASNGAILCKALKDTNATVMQATPASWRLLLASGWRPDGNLRIWCGGEALSQPLAEELTANGNEVWNLYGPTETTVWSTGLRLSDGGQVSVGGPLSNTKTFVLDDHLEVTPVGVAGELYIAGVGLARGYLKRPGLTAERFLPCTFGHGARMYRTGDLARWTPDGVLQHLGRVDHQVKIRGYRIELEEIEATLSAHASVKQAAVVAREDQPEDKRLVAYVVADTMGVDFSGLRSHLKQRLPDYMIPSAFVVVDALPLTPNGKVDRKALPAPGRDRGDEAKYIAPRNPTEDVLASLWAEVLKLDRVGVLENFFELGGHSLLAMRLIARLREEFGIEMPLRTLFEAPSLEQLAECVEAAQRGGTGRVFPPLAAMPHEGAVPLSFEQERLWLLEQLEGLGPAYNVAGAVRMAGLLDVTALEACFREMVRRHEVLRTRFGADAGVPHQIIDEPNRVSFDIVDLMETADAAKREAEARRHLRTETSRPFDLMNGPLFRVKLIRLESDTHFLVVVMHHIISDGWSIGVLIREIEALYAAFVVGRASPLPALAVQYADYAIWQRNWLHGEMLEKQLAYWKACLAGAPAAIELPADHARPASPSYRGGSVSVRFSSGLTEELKRFSRGAGATLFMVLLAGFQLLLKRYSGQEDIVVGSPVAGRTHRELEGLIGFFTNTLALRTDLSGNPTFRELVRRVKETSLEAYAHQGLPFEKLVEELKPVRDASRQPIFQFLFVLQNLPEQTLELPNLRVSRMGGEQTTSKLDLSLYLQERAGVLQGYFEYATDLFERSTIERLASHFHVLLEAAVGDPDVRLNELPLVTEAERSRIVEEWNQTAVGCRQYGDLYTLFSEQVARTPEAVALIHRSGALTFTELNRRVDRLAWRLRSLGVGPETVVGLCLDRSFEMVTSMLAVLKSGGFYLPLEPSAPRERLDFMLNDAGVRHLMTCRAHRDATRFNGAVLVVDDADELTAEEDYESECSLLRGIHPDNAACIVYTSGSTGRPKGIVVTHRSLTNFLCWRQQTFALGPADRLIFKASYGSDFAIPELFWGLITGGSVVLASDEEARDVVALIASIKRHGVTVAELAPSLLWTVLEEASFRDCTSLRTIISGGEALSEALAMRCSAISSAQLINVYGPSEATVEATYWRYHSGCVGISIGQPIWNMRAHVLDDDQKPLPVGFVGELYLGGVGIARGYLRRPGLTAERFVPSPFEMGERLYRTGDLVRRFADGNLEFLGRRDRQLKIRGYRVELGEVEAALTEHASVDRAIVVAQRDEVGDLRLVGYVVAADGLTVLPGELRVYLQRTLPDYMVPPSFVVLDRLPMTANGKVDLRALPAPADDAVTRGKYVAPLTSTEKLLAEIWRELLKLDRVGLHDNFFELGGNSLLAMRLMARIRTAFQVEFPVRALFDTPTLGEVSLKLDQQQNGTGDVARATEEMVAAMSADEVRAMLQKLRAERGPP